MGPSLAQHQLLLGARQCCAQAKQLHRLQPAKDGEAEGTRAAAVSQGLAVLCSSPPLGGGGREVCKAPELRASQAASPGSSQPRLGRPRAQALMQSLSTWLVPATPVEPAASQSMGGADLSAACPCQTALTVSAAVKQGAKAGQKDKHRCFASRGAGPMLSAGHAKVATN